MLSLILSVASSPNTKKLFFDYHYEMTHYQQQKLHET